MPVATRSQGKESGGGSLKPPATKRKGNDGTSRKRKGQNDNDVDRRSRSPPKKRQRGDSKDSPAKNGSDTVKQEGETVEKKGEGIITINRAPVLQLWGASVAHFLHPDLSWDICLAVGNSISTLTAISKGRSIGTIPASTKDKSSSKKKDDKEPSFRVMGFPMTVKNDGVVVKGKVTKANEGDLKTKFGGDEQYDAARTAMRKALESWKGSDKEELDKKAFHMYEQFRPSVPPGQKGWGRKGKLDLVRVAEVVRHREG